MHNKVETNASKFIFGFEVENTSLCMLSAVHMPY